MLQKKKKKEGKERSLLLCQMCEPGLTQSSVLHLSFYFLMHAFVFVNFHCHKHTYYKIGMHVMFVVE